MRMLRLATGSLLSALLLLGAVSEAAPRPGDLLITDSNNGRVLRVVPRTGSVETLSPKPDQTNHLQRPTGIAISRSDRAIYVIDDEDGQLVRIDPTTGEQAVQRTRVLDDSTGVPMLIPVPLVFPGTIRGLEIPPKDPAAAGDRVLVIGSAGVHETRFNGTYWTTPELRTGTGFPIPSGTALDRYGDPLRLWVASGGEVLQQATAANGGLALGLAAIALGESIVDVDVSASGREAMLVRSTPTPFTCANARVVSFAQQALSASTELRCPLVLALGLRDELYVADALLPAGGFVRIVRVEDGEGAVVGELPDGGEPLTRPAGMVVVPGEATFEWIAEETGDVRPIGASASGDILVGIEFDGPDVSWWRWTPSGGREVMGPGEATGLSSDASVVVGLLPSEEVFLWRSSSGFAEPPPLAPVPGASFSAPLSISGNGEVAVGFATIGAEWRAVRWGPGAPTLLPSLPDTQECYGVRASHDGSVVAGICRSMTQRRGVRWDASGAPLDLGDLGEGSYIEWIRDIAADGRTLLLDAFHPVEEWTALRWTEAGGLESLHPLASGYQSGARSMSRDGRRVLFSRIGSPEQRGSSLWDAALGTRDLWTELVDGYGVDVPPTVAEGAGLLTKDGRTLFGVESRTIGLGSDDTTLDHWRIRLAPEADGTALALGALGVLAGWARVRRVARAA